MACCCCFLCGVHIRLNYVVSVKESHYQAVFTNEGAAKTPLNLPNVNLSPSYSVIQGCSQPGNEGFPGLLSMGKFAIRRSQDLMDCFSLKDESGQQVCIMTAQGGCCSSNVIFMDNQGNELIRAAVARNAPQGSRQIGTMKSRTTCVCSSNYIYGNTSDFHLKVISQLHGKRFISSKDGREVAQVFSTPVRIVANGFFPPDLELGMKASVIAFGIGLLISDPYRNQY